MIDDTNGGDCASPGELQMVRSLLGLTQKRMGAELGISERTVQEYENGRRATPRFITAALNFITIRVAVKDRDPRLTTNATGHLVDELAEIRAEHLLGEKINGWAVYVGGLSPENRIPYSWAVAVDDETEALKVMATRQAAPEGGFKVIARLSQFTIARLRLKRGEACPL